MILQQGVVRTADLTIRECHLASVVSSEACCGEGGRLGVYGWAGGDRVGWGGAWAVCINEVGLVVFPIHYAMMWRISAAVRPGYRSWFFAGRPPGPSVHTPRPAVINLMPSLPHTPVRAGPPSCKGSTPSLSGRAGEVRSRWVSAVAVGVLRARLGSWDPSRGRVRCSGDP